MVSVSSFQNHFDTHLSQGLEILEIKRKSIIRFVILAKILNALTLTVFFSLFLGFLNAFPFDDFEMGFAFEGFFYLILSFVAFGVFRKDLLYILEIMDRKALTNNKLIINILTAIISVICLSGAWYTGTKYLGGATFALSFVIKYIIGFFILLLLGLLSFVFQQYENKFNQSFKTECLPKILRFLNSTANYNPAASTEQELFEKSGLFRYTEIYRYKGSDHISGSYGSGNFEFSQLDITQRTTTTSVGKTEVRIENLFKGLFFSADFNKPFNCLVVISPDYTRKALDTQLGEMLNKAMEYNQYQLVKLEDVEFEEEFTVYATEQVEARHILSPALIERIKKLRIYFGKEIRLSFANNKVFLALASDNDLLSPIVFHKVTDFHTIEPVYQIMEAFCSIPDRLDLNTRIWGK